MWFSLVAAQYVVDLLTDFRHIVTMNAVLVLEVFPQRFASRSQIGRWQRHGVPVKDANGVP
jgi:hypothetical protein